MASAHVDASLVKFPPVCPHCNRPAETSRRLTAVRLRATSAKRGRRETQVMNMPESGVGGLGSGGRAEELCDLQAVLDEELSRLPDHYRGVIILCDLEGMTRKEAAAPGK